MGGDGKTVLKLAGTGTTKFSGGLFRGKLIFWGTAPHYFLGGLFADG